MKVVVIGGTGLIGSKVVSKLTQRGHEALAAAPNTGVNTITDTSTMLPNMRLALSTSRAAGVSAR